MKINITENDYKKEKPFPKLMMLESGSTNLGRIVLFVSNSCGTVLYNNNKNSSEFCIGKYRTDWDIKCFKDLNGTIKLSND